MPNQNPEQVGRNEIDKQIDFCGLIIQDKDKINLNAGLGVAVPEYQTDIGSANYVLFVNKRPVAIIKAKREEEGHRLTVHENQAL